MPWKDGHPKSYDAMLKRRVGNACHTIRRRADKEGTPFDLVPQDLYDIIPDDGLCPVFKQPFDVGMVTGGKQGPRPMSVSVDRIIPELGYVPGNIRLISMKANQIMSNVSIEDIEAVLNYLKETNQ